MVKFLHTADWQMGSKSQQLGTKAGEGRNVRLQSIKNIVDVAKKENVDFVLIAGDVFEDSNVDNSIIRSVVETLNDFKPIQTFLIPGNHDPFIPGGIWERASWGGIKDHIHLLSEPEEVEPGQNLVIYPCPLKQKMGKRDPTDWIPSREEGDTRIRIGLAHGSLDFIKEPNFPIATDRTRKSGLDYLALGDWHGFYQQGKAVYSGTPEQTSYADKSPGKVAVVEITGAGAEPVVQTQQVGILNWIEIQPLVQEESDIDSFEKQVSGIEEYSKTVMKVRPQISTPIRKEVFDRLKGIREYLSSKLWYLDWPLDYDSIDYLTLERLPTGMFVELEDYLLKLSKGENLESSLANLQSNHNPDVAAEAIRLLHRFASEGKIDDT
ncbi:MAG: DNA repair exonuclease [Thermoplasmatales archaeon]